MNHRYFYKRAYYLACIAAAVKGAKSGYDISFDLLNGNQLQPTICVKPMHGEFYKQLPSSE